MANLFHMVMLIEHFWEIFVVSALCDSELSGSLFVIQLMNKKIESLVRVYGCCNASDGRKYPGLWNIIYVL